MVLIRRETTSVELNTSSVMGPEVLDEGAKLITRKGMAWPFYEIQEIHFYSLLKEFSDVVSDNPPSELPPDRGVRYEIDLKPGTKYCTTRQWPLPKEQVDAIDDFSRTNTQQVLFRSRSRHTRRRRFVCGNPMGIGAWFMLSTN